jgi:hypothetical protein
LDRTPGTETDRRNDLSSILDEQQNQLQKVTNKLAYDIPGFGPSIPSKKTKIKYTETRDIRMNRLEGRLDIQNGSDRLNREVAWYSEDGTPPKDGNDKTLDDYSMIPLRFYSISKKSGISFRAVIDGLSESFSPSWDVSRFVGNPYNFYTYNSIDRSVSFNFKIFSLNMNEHKSMWQKISFLTTMVYPQKFATRGITPPFIKFTLGDMYYNKEAFIESMTYSVDDNVPWEIGLNKSSANFQIEGDNSLKDYKLPTVISVQITLKFVESQSTHWSESGSPKRMYDYGGVPREIATISEKNRRIRPDGSAIDEKTNVKLGTPSRSYDMLPTDELTKNIKRNLDIYAKEGPDVQDKLGNITSGLSIIRR